MMRLIVVFAFLSFFAASAAHATGACDFPALAHQRKSQATVLRLEHAWTAAFLRGDTNFERCLLTPDFTEISRAGAVLGLSDELALAAKNKGKDLPDANAPHETIFIHGNVAVAYAKQDWTAPDGKPGTRTFADYYVWENGAWHAYFSQSTAAEK
jgi:hypothetical protein